VVARIAAAKNRDFRTHVSGLLPHRRWRAVEGVENRENERDRMRRGRVRASTTLEFRARCGFGPDMTKRYSPFLLHGRRPSHYSLSVWPDPLHAVRAGLAIEYPPRALFRVEGLDLVRCFLTRSQPRCRWPRMCPGTARNDGVRQAAGLVTVGTPSGSALTFAPAMSGKAHYQTLISVSDFRPVFRGWRRSETRISSALAPRSKRSRNTSRTEEPPHDLTADQSN